MGESFFVSIIIPALNEQENIPACLSALNELDFPDEQYEILLIDNGSTDQTIEIARTFDVRIVEQPEVNISALRNLGAAHAKGNILAFIDADCIASKDWLKHATPYFHDQTIGVVGSRYQLPPDSNWIEKAWHIHTAKSRTLTGDVKWLPGGNLIVSRQCFFQVGGFNEGLVTSEDIDFCATVRAKNFRVFSNPKIAVIHKGHPKTLPVFYRKEIWYGREMYALFLRNFPRLTNYRPVAFGLFYFVCLIAILITTPLGFVYGDFTAPICLFASLWLVCLSLATYRVISYGDMYEYVAPLTLLYFLYGISKAICILHLRIARPHTPTEGQS
jgi:cellulose synthase/poly-beta-1,6-N-acetylglucosamine synthase-like glycosyltransferase